MGLLLSVLVGCVGLLELLACLRQLSDGLIIGICPPTPCLSYHDGSSEHLSSHDSLCNISHSSELRLPRGTKHKLENLHEYSLRIRSELRSLDKDYYYHYYYYDGGSTLSECSTRDLLTSSRPESRLSLDHEEQYDDDDEEEQEEEKKKDVRHTREQRENVEVEEEQEQCRRQGAEDSSMPYDEHERNEAKTAEPEPARYIRIPTPIPMDLSRSNSASELAGCFACETDSGNETPTTESLDRPSRPTSSKTLPTVEPKVTEDLHRVAEKLASTAEPESSFIVDHPAPARKKVRTSKSSSTILRKPTRLKSRNAEVSKSAENLSIRAFRRRRDSQRRKSEISVQTKDISRFYRDESTNTTPPTDDGELSRASSRASLTVSVHVQTSFEERLPEDEIVQEYKATGLSEDTRELSSQDRPLKCKRFRSWVKGPDEKGLFKASRTEELEIQDDHLDNDADDDDDDDDEFVDCDQDREHPIQNSSWDTDQNKAFWVMRVTSPIPKRKKSSVNG